MKHDYTDLIRQAESAATQLQAEIDAAIDEHGVLRRFVDAMRSPADVVQWVPTTVPSGKDLDAPIEEVRAGLLTVKPKAKVATKHAAKRRSRQSSVDYGAVAPWINAAKANGTYSVKALAAAFNVPGSTAKNWAGHCKARGLLDAELPLGRPSEARPLTAAPTVAEPKPSTPTLTRGTERDGQGNPSSFSTRAKVLACSECDFECDTARASQLNHHCLDAHSRRPTLDERMPVMAVAS